MVLGQPDRHMQVNEFGSFLMPYIKQLKMNQGPKCKSENYKTFRRTHRLNSSWYWIRQWFLRYDQKHKQQKKKYINRTSTELKILCFKNTVKKRKSPMNGRKYLYITYLTRDLYLDYIRKSYNSIIKKQSDFKMSRDLNIHFS